MKGTFSQLTYFRYATDRVHLTDLDVATENVKMWAMHNRRLGGFEGRIRSCVEMKHTRLQVAPIVIVEQVETLPDLPDS